MGSTLILKVRICLKPLQPFFHQGTSAFLTINTPVSLVVPPIARFLCTRHTNYNPARSKETDRRNNKQTNRQAGGNHGTNRWAEEELWDGTVERRGKKEQSFHKSVFAAGTAKRTAEMLKRKAPMAHDDENEESVRGEPVRRESREAGRGNCNWHNKAFFHCYCQSFLYKICTNLYSLGNKLHSFAWGFFREDAAS